MLTTLSYGEVLVDMLSNRMGGKTDEPETFTKFAGGAPANVAVAIARLGGHCRMVGKLGNDMFGEFLRGELQQAGVNTDCLLSTSDANTALAFVSLDHTGERSFSFYRNPSADMLFTTEEFDDDWFAQPGIFHFCSNTLTTPEVAAVTQAGVEKVSSQEFVVSFDVNLRHNLWPTGQAELSALWPLITKADLLKMSKEELEYLVGQSTEAETLTRIAQGATRLLLITDGGNPLRVLTKTGPEPTPMFTETRLTPPAVKMVDSTGAGDAFVGGLLYQLASQNIGRSKLAHFCSNSPMLEQALLFAARCGGQVASRYGAFAAMEDLGVLVAEQAG